MSDFYERTERVEAMQWVGVLHGTDDDDVFNWTLIAERIIAWVNANGGEARYEPDGWNSGLRDGRSRPARIAVRTSTGWAYAAPGDWIVMTDEIIDGKPQESRHYRLFRVIPAAEWSAQGWSAASAVPVQAGEAGQR